MSFFTSLTGLNAAQTELATVSNNIANTGTNGFKRSRVTFGDIIASSPLQNPSRIVGSGVAVKSIAQQFQQGAIETSDYALDLAVSGQGFFVVKGAQGDAQVAFTRNGAFSVTPDRYVVDASGRRVQLFPTTSDGSVLTTELGATINAKLPLTSGSPQATGTIKLAVNLPSDSEVIPAKAIYTATNPYVFDRSNPSTFNKSTSETIYDSLGNPLAATIYYVKTAVPAGADPNHHWTAHVFVGDTELKQSGVAGMAMTFDSGGVLTAPTTPAVFDAFQPLGGGDPQVLAIDHGIATTQQSGAFAVTAVSQDGFQTGQLESVSVDTSGKLQASYSNGEIHVIGKIAMAIFSNPQGLKQIGDATYVSSPLAGPALTGEGGKNGLGQIMSGSLERSNVDLTAELVGLITAQRNFQANAKAIETSSSLLSTIVNMRS